MRFATASALFWAIAATAMKINSSDPNSIKDAAKSVAKNLVSYYHGAEPGRTPGILDGPPPRGDYYWWEAAAMWDTLINYWQYTGDSSYNDLVTQGILWQVGPGNAFMPPNQTFALGNDDQGFWGMAAMTAAEAGLANPSNGSDTQWLSLAENVFATFVQPSRWNEDTCGGGLRWQILPSNVGYNYKNSASTGVLFNVAARLARLTRNATYADWAETAWTWMEAVGYLKDGAIYDGASVETNCTDINHLQFSYLAGIFAQGAAHMFNYTKAAVWERRLTTLVNTTTSTFFAEDSGIAVEVTCEVSRRCTTDMLAFKGILIRGLGSAARLAPYTRALVADVLGHTAEWAADSCDDEGRCGFIWLAGSAKTNVTHGVGQQMNALSALSVMLPDQAAAPPVNGTSGGGGGGAGSPTQTTGAPTTKSTGGDKSGAGVTADRAGAGFVVTSAVLAVMFTALLA